jgi:hypothetical protein
VIFLEQFRTYPGKPEWCVFYTKYVRGMADALGLATRELDIALWALDKEKA